MRAPVPAVLVGLLAASIGAVILGEYPLVGFRALLAGLVFGVTVAELMAGVARPGPDEQYLPFSAAMLTEGGLVWATWISTGHELDTASTAAWLGIGVGMLSSLLWFRSAARRGASIRDAAAPSPGG
jgi:hypothetical protein